MNDLTQRSSSRKRLGAKLHQSSQKVELARMIKEKLAAQFVPKLTTISAPTGYGKTTFLTQLYRVIAAGGRPCILIALDQEDTELNSVLRLLSHAVALSEGKGGLVEATATSGHADPQDRLIARLAALGTPVLFIDNLHFCTDPAIAGLLDALIFSTGAALRLILSSTGVIPFNQGRAKLEQAVKWKDAMLRGILLRRMGEPEDYAGLVAFLASADGNFITGQTFSVSGGMNMI